MFKVFEVNHVHEVEVMEDIWMRLIHALKGQYDDHHDSSDEVVRHRLTFHVKWKDSPFCIIHNGTM